MTSEPIVNKVATSSLHTLNLEDYRPTGERMALDIQHQLFQGLLLREKDFRAWVKFHDWAQYQGAHVAVFCGTDAIIPVWAYMLVASALQPFAATVFLGTPAQLDLHLYRRALAEVDWSAFRDEKMVLKGCGTVPAEVYTEATAYLLPYADKIMFGEPCSTVPIWRRAPVVAVNG